MPSGYFGLRQFNCSWGSVTFQYLTMARTATCLSRVIELGPPDRIPSQVAQGSLRRERKGAGIKPEIGLRYGSILRRRTIVRVSFRIARVN